MADNEFDIGAEEEIDDEDDDENGETLVGDIDRINLALGIYKENAALSDSDTDGSDIEEDVETKVAKATGFLDADLDEYDRLANRTREGEGVVDDNGEPSTIGGCDLSQDIHDLELSQSETSLENCLYLNHTYQEYIASAIDDLEILLFNNREKQKIAQDNLNMLCNDGKLSNGSFTFTSKMRIPYFKLASGLFPPPNDDTKIKQANQELPPLIRLPRSWSTNTTSKLQEAVERNSFELSIQPIMARREILFEELENKKDLSVAVLKTKQAEYTEKEQLLKMLTSQPPSTFVSESRDKNYDWMKISAVEFDGQHSPRDCELYWKNFLHPSISKNKWTKLELAKLNNLVACHGTNNWDLVAEKLQTNRIAVGCAETYQSVANQRKAPWSIEEKLELMNVVEACRIGDYIPFHQVAYSLEGRTSTEAWHQWTYSLDPSIKRGRWTEEEDTMLLTAVWLLGAKNWFQIKNFVRNRTDVQCSDRWKFSLDPSLKTKEFTRTDDRRLLDLVNKHGKKWAIVGKELGRTANRCLGRYKLLMYYKNEGLDANSMPKSVRRNDLKRYREKLYKIVTARLLEISQKDVPAIKTLQYLKLRNNFQAFSVGGYKKTVGELELAEHLKKCHIESVIETMKQKPEPLVKKISSVERGLQEFFKISSKRRHRGRPPRLFDIEEDDVTYQDAIHEIHSLMQGRHGNSSDSNPIPILPPMITTMQAFRSILLMRKRMLSLIPGNQGKTQMEKQASEMQIEAINDENAVDIIEAGSTCVSYNDLFVQFISLFTWPALLSSIKPLDEPAKQPKKERRRRRGPKRTLGHIKDTEFRCFAKPTGDGVADLNEPPIKRKRGRPRRKASPLPEREPTRRSARNRLTDM